MPCYVHTLLHLLLISWHSLCSNGAALKADGVKQSILKKTSPQAKVSATTSLVVLKQHAVSCRADEGVEPIP